MDAFDTFDELFKILKEFGIPFTILIKALKNGIKIINGSRYAFKPKLMFSNNTWYLDQPFTYHTLLQWRGKVKDFGKTWTLAEEGDEFYEDLER